MEERGEPSLTTRVASRHAFLPQYERQPDFAAFPLLGRRIRIKGTRHAQPPAGRRRGRGLAHRDALSGPDRFWLVSATSNEPDDGVGDGDTANDVAGFDAGTPDLTGSLRAERSATGNGRIYSLTYRGLDRAGNAADCATTVAVPKQGR